MKGSAIRKRYIIVKGEKNFLDPIIVAVYRKFGCKVKYRNERYCIILANQINKESVISFISGFGNYQTIKTCGTMLKCRKTIMKLSENPGMKNIN
ncbi:MAG: hypothetical protein ACP5UV_04405 [Thermoplasmata archaeon]